MNDNLLAILIGSFFGLLASIPTGYLINLLFKWNRSYNPDRRDRHFKRLLKEGYTVDREIWK